jgi:Tfp pilus assembly ATPase PilU
MPSNRTALLVRSIMNDRQAREFDQHREVNFSLNFPDVARFRVSAFTQRGSAGMVLRLIQQQIPTIEELNLPPILQDIAMHQARAGDFPGRHRLRQDHVHGGHGGSSQQPMPGAHYHH